MLKKPFVIFDKHFEVLNGTCSVSDDIKTTIRNVDRDIVPQRVNNAFQRLICKNQIDQSSGLIVFAKKKRK